MAIFLIILFIVFVVDIKLYGKVPYNYKLKFNQFCRRSIIGSGIFIWLHYILKSKI